MISVYNRADAIKLACKNKIYNETDIINNIDDTAPGEFVYYHIVHNGSYTSYLYVDIDNYKYFIYKCKCQHNKYFIFREKLTNPHTIALEESLKPEIEKLIRIEKFKLLNNK